MWLFQSQLIQPLLNSIFLILCKVRDEFHCKNLFIAQKYRVDFILVIIGSMRTKCFTKFCYFQLWHFMFECMFSIPNLFLTRNPTKENFALFISCALHFAFLFLILNEIPHLHLGRKTLENLHSNCLFSFSYYSRSFRFSFASVSNFCPIFSYSFSFSSIFLILN